MSISASDVKALRDRTGAGMMDCKNALSEADGDMEKAVETLRVKGQAQAAKRAGREAAEGVVAPYIHSGGKIGVLVEVNCETDFVARNDDFQEFAREIALHIAAADPEYVTADEIPSEDEHRERGIHQGKAREEGKPDHVIDKIVDGQMAKWREQVVLLEQPHVNGDKHDGKTIEQLRAEFAAKTGENVQITRFARFQVGAGSGG
ncbi:MAG: translation elongation factor Ts [Solirubrobacterales bacterium]